MRKKIEKPETLESALKELVHMVRSIKVLQEQINDTWGVDLSTSRIPGYGDGISGEVCVIRGIEEVEAHLERETKSEQNHYYSELRRLRHNGVLFTQVPAMATAKFVKAWEEQPKLTIMEE